MNDTTKDWLDRAIDAIREAAGEEGAKAINAEWSAFDAVDMPVVTVFGSYDSGKSTLLKRLLVDAGEDVPSWLTVSARRETFEIKEVDALGCRFRDTPGIAGGNSEHEQIAREAVTSSDVILLVVPPQLLTGDREAVISVLSGETFRKGGLPMAGAVLTAIAKLDEGSVDPTEDQDSYHEYLIRKQKEWSKLLETTHVDLPEKSIFMVAADPFQRVGNDPSPSPSDYRMEYRAWDGVGVLSSAIEELPRQFHSLRPAAQRRFFCSRMEALRQAAEARGIDVKLARDVAKENRERFSLLQQQLEALLGAARASLDGVLEDVLVTAARSRIESSDAVNEFLEPRMNKAVGRWWDDQMASLQKLIGEAEAQVETRTRSTGTSKARRTLDADDIRGGNETSLSKDRLTSIFNKAKALLKDYHEHKLGMKLSKAREELRKLDQAKNFNEYAKAAGRRESFKTLAEAEKAKMIVGFHVTASVAPAVIELGALIWEESQRRKNEQENVKRRDAIRETLRKEAVKIADATWKEWRLTADDFMQWIQLHGGVAKSTEDAFVAEIHIIETTISKLGMALA